MSETTYLELVEGVGMESEFLHEIDPKTGEYKRNPKAGQPAPLCEIKIPIPIPVMAGKEVVVTTRTVDIKPLERIDPDDPLEARIIPGTRIVETHAPEVVNRLVETGHYQVCDQPHSEQPRKPHAARKDHGATTEED